MGPNKRSHNQQKIYGIMTLNSLLPLLGRDCQTLLLCATCCICVSCKTTKSAPAAQTRSQQDVKHDVPNQAAAEAQAQAIAALNSQTALTPAQIVKLKREVEHGSGYAALLLADYHAFNLNDPGGSWEWIERGAKLGQPRCETEWAGDLWNNHAEPSREALIKTLQHALDNGYPHAKYLLDKVMKNDRPPLVVTPPKS
jgi:hypothetical protein